MATSNSTVKARLAAPSVAATAQRVAVASGPVCGGRRTKEMVKRLKVGQIALIDHLDVDTIAGQALVEKRPAAVLDARAPMSGRYPNRGPAIIVAAGIPLFHLLKPELFDKFSEGSLALYSDGSIKHNGLVYEDVAERWDRNRLKSEAEKARANIGVEIQRFADNTLHYIHNEAEEIFDPAAIPALTGVASMEKRHVVIVVRGEGYKEDLASIRGYMRDVRPILIGVDGGADALLDAGFKPNIILGDMDSVSDRALLSGAKLVVHGYSRNVDAPGSERLQALNLPSEVYRVSGTSEDAAMVLAYEKGAELIVAVGTHSNLEDFLDKGRAGMASTFLTRLKVGSRLVDARGVSRLHHRQVGVTEMAALLLSAAFVMVTLLLHSPMGLVVARSTHLWWRLTLVNLSHLLTHLKLH